MATVQKRFDPPGASARVSSEILDRLPPHSLDAEKSVLASLLIDPPVADDVAVVVRADDFYSDAHQRVYRQMLALHDQNRTIDITLLVDRLKATNELELVGGMAYLAEIVNSTPTAANAVYYADIVASKATLRSLIHASTEILRDAYDPTFEASRLLSRAEERIFAIHDQKGGGELKNMNEVLHETFDQIDKWMLEGRSTGVPTGFTDLDDLTGGLHPSELAILAARPSMGKTSLAMNIAENITLHHTNPLPVLLVSLEMARMEIAQRMLCSLGKIDGRKFRKGIISASERDQLVEASNDLSRAQLFIDDTASRTVTEIAATARRLKRSENLGLVIIDYLQLVEPDNSADPRQEQVAKIARRLKGLARELKLPVLCLAQLNRQAEATKDNRPRLSHLRESGAIEQDADVVMFIHREERFADPEELEPGGGKEHLKGLAEVIVGKQRNGPIGEVKLTWIDKYTRFENYTPDPYSEFEDF